MSGKSCECLSVIFMSGVKSSWSDHTLREGSGSRNSHHPEAAVSLLRCGGLEQGSCPEKTATVSTYNAAAAAAAEFASKRSPDHESSMVQKDELHWA
jgi:hypothetical protein